MSLFTAFLLEMAVPALILGALAVGVPLVFARGAMTQAALARGIGVSALVCVGAGGVVLFAQYTLLSPGQGRLLMVDPLGRLGFFLGQSLRAGVIWGPILAVVWLIRAQGVEERRGLLMEDKR
jgi:hypothetical protein